MAHLAPAQGELHPEYSRPKTPGTSSVEQREDGSDKHLMRSHDWSHARPAGLVGGDMDGDLS